MNAEKWFFLPILLVPALVSFLFSVYAAVHAYLLPAALSEQHLATKVGRVAQARPSPRGQEDIWLEGGERYVLCYALVGNPREQTRCRKEALTLIGKNVELLHVNRFPLRKHVLSVTALDESNLVVGSSTATLVKSEKSKSLLLAITFILLTTLAIIVLRAKE